MIHNIAPATSIEFVPSHLRPSLWLRLALSLSAFAIAGVIVVGIAGAWF